METEIETVTVLSVADRDRISKNQQAARKRLSEKRAVAGPRGIQINSDLTMKKMEFCEYKTLKTLLREVKRARQKFKALNSKDLEFVQKYIYRSTHHGQKKVMELIGIDRKNRIVFIKDTRNVCLVKTHIREYNKAVAEYKGLLATSVNESINLEDLRSCLGKIEDSIKLLGENSKFHSWWYEHKFNLKTDSKIKICEACTRTIVYETTKSDMTREELEDEENRTNQQQRDHDKSREGKKPQYYECMSSFCFGTCSRCEDRQGEMYPRIIFKPNTKVGTDWRICGCGRLVLKTYNCN